MFETFSGSMFSLNVRDEAMVNCASPGFKLDDGVLQPLPEATTSFAPGALQAIPTLPPVATRRRSTTDAAFVPVNMSISPLFSVRMTPKPTEVPALSTSRLRPAVLLLDETMNVRTLPLLNTCSTSVGDAVPTPTFPVALISIELVGAPGRMRRGRREPPVTSRPNQLAS